MKENSSFLHVSVCVLHMHIQYVYYQPLTFCTPGAQSVQGVCFGSCFHPRCVRGFLLLAPLCVNEVPFTILVSWTVLAFCCAQETHLSTLYGYLCVLAQFGSLIHCLAEQKRITLCAWDLVTIWKTMFLIKPQKPMYNLRIRTNVFIASCSSFHYYILGM